jgi:hypothetical protein
VIQPSPKLSQASIVTGRSGPSRLHKAISTAPVSEAGTMPMRWLGGTRSTWRVSSMAWPSRALPSRERCDRPSDPMASLAGAQPGGLAHGPEEK